MTPFLIDLAVAFSPATAWRHGPWEFDGRSDVLRFYGRPVEPCGWTDMTAMAAGDPDATRWLRGLREDVVRRLANQASTA